MNMTDAPNFPVCRPLLPDHQAILPYIKQIDANRHYTNFGPLVQKAELKFAQMCGVEPQHILTTSSGMSALSLILSSFDIPLGSHVALPSWTFSATAHAVLNAGLIPVFVDVERQSWAMTPASVEAVMAEYDVALVMPVAPFGLPLSISEWEDFSNKYNVPVVVDGATLCPEDIQPSDCVPIMVSLHATKVMNAGEGGLIIWKDAARIVDLRNRSGFGLLNPEGICVKANNAKMSEYHAALALASLNRHDVTRLDFMRIAARYHQNFQSNESIHLLPDYGTQRYNSFCVLTSDKPIDTNVLDGAAIGWRHWWRRGCHREPLFAGYPRTDLAQTEYLANHTIGLPCYRGLADSDIDYICETVAKAL